MIIESIGYNVKHCSDFEIRRPNGCDNYLFLFFTSEVYLKVDGRIVKASPNSFIIYTPKHPQFYYNYEDGFEHDWFHFDGAEVEAFLKLLRLPLNTLFQVSNYNFIRTFVKSIEREYVGRDLFWEQNINGLFISNLVNLAREYNYNITHDINPYKTDMLEKLKAVRLEVLTSSEKQWNIEMMSSLAGLSRSRFSVLYKEFFLSSPKEDLINERINKAKYLLSFNTMSVSSVAYRIGYDNIYHFNRQFKKIVGIAPGKYYRSRVSEENVKNS